MRKLFTNIAPPANSAIVVAAGKVISMEIATAESVQVLSGRVWLTISGQKDDYWLGAGQYLNVPAGSRLVVEGDQSGGVFEMRKQSSAAQTSARAGHRLQAVMPGKLQCR
ncbi:DUF2917 domain-containing protein [Glaciimonas soli]|uniref:DUF2917 domain-containing protein n=1 Tax=Glaciimonas soli TaxID=2590999 RepID=A0A843YT99_9BURK|nr:DUF2917 domain-containing protein [Glaciimonas soli]MQR00571.1 DUF2917 domain-containing protein [Glaciimonas soli]